MNAVVMRMDQHIEHKHVLFVDDDPASRRLVARMLRSGVPGVRVTCAGDGSQALDVLGREQVDLLITDLAMPVVDGIELLLQVARRRLVVPLLVVTGHGSPTAETRALSGGAIEYFEKPLRAEPFIACIQNLLREGRQGAQLDVVSLAGIVRIISMERRTCALRVTSAGAQGVLIFSAGELVDAREGEQSGLAAALAILGRIDASVTLDIHARARTRTIHASVTEVLRQASARRHPGEEISPGSPVAATAGPRNIPELPPDFGAPPAASPQPGASGSPRPRQPIVMPAPMPAPASTRPVLPPPPAPVGATPERAPTVVAAPSLPPPPRLPLRSPPLVSRPLTPPPVPAPPRVSAAPRPPSPPPIAAPPPPILERPTDTTEDAAPTAIVPAASRVSPPNEVPASAASEASPPELAVVAALPAAGPSPPMTPMTPVAAAPEVAPVSVAPTLAAFDELLAGSDYFELVDHARDLLRVAEFDIAERLLRRALQLRPEDRVVQQNLRVLARRRGTPSEMNH